MSWGILLSGKDSSFSADQSEDDYVESAAGLKIPAACHHSDSSACSLVESGDPVGADHGQEKDAHGHIAAADDSSGSTLRAATQSSSLDISNSQTQAALLRQYTAVARSSLKSLAASSLQSLAAKLQKIKWARLTPLQALTTKITVKVSRLSAMPAMSQDQWQTQADSADDVVEPVAAGDHHAAHQHSAQDPLQPAESVSILHANSQYMDISSILSFAAVDLQTQCVDTTLLLPDNSTSQLDTVQEELPECRAILGTQQDGEHHTMQSKFVAVQTPDMGILRCSLLIFYVVMWIVSLVSIYVNSRRLQ